MKVLNKKLSKNGGFTLVELLIVVAIIAILVAISIPMLMESLEKSRHGVDEANYRDAISLANVRYLTNINEFAGKEPKYYVYCVDRVTHQGTLSDEITTFESGTTSVTSVENAVRAECTEAYTASGDRASGANSFANAYLIVKIAPPAKDKPNGTPFIVAGWVNSVAQFKSFQIGDAENYKFAKAN